MNDGGLVVQAALWSGASLWLTARLRRWAREARDGSLLDRSDHELRQVRQWVAGQPRWIPPRWLGWVVALVVGGVVTWLVAEHRWLDLVSVAMMTASTMVPAFAKRALGPTVLGALGDRGLAEDEPLLAREASERRRRWTRRWLLVAAGAAAASVTGGLVAGSTSSTWSSWVAAGAGLVAVLALGGAGWANAWVYGDERPAAS